MSIKTGCSLLDFGQPLRKNGKRLPCEVMHDENAKLRDERDRMYKANVDKNGEILRLLEENVKLRESLERAAGIIADICGECPVIHYELLSSDGCDEKCGTVTEEECWIAYLTGKRWDESGAEVDE